MLLFEQDVQDHGLNRFVYGLVRVLWFRVNGMGRGIATKPVRERARKIRMNARISIRTSTYIHPLFHQSVCPSVYVSAYMPINRSMCLSTCMYTYVLYTYNEYVMYLIIHVFACSYILCIQTSCTYAHIH